MTVPPWPARTVGNRILCGRQVAGRYVCRGVIATIDRDWQDRRGPGVTTYRVILASGLTLEMAPDPGTPGLDVDHWRDTQRARAQRARRQKPDGYGMLGPSMIRRRRFPDMAHVRYFPFTRHCPMCNVLSLVTDDLVRVLDS